MAVTLINVFTVPNGKEDEFVKWWEDVRANITKQQGFISGKFHKSTKPDSLGLRANSTCSSVPSSRLISHLDVRRLDLGRATPHHTALLLSPPASADPLTPARRTVMSITHPPAVSCAIAFCNSCAFK